MSNQESNMNRLSMNDLMYNIETKISLLSQIQESVGLKNKNSNEIMMNLNKNDSEQFSQINLPMQILNKKMMDILNKSSNEIEKNYERTESKKRMQLNDLETGTRNVDEIKRQNQQTSGIKLGRIYNEGLIGEFKQNHSEIFMSESMMSSSKSSSKIINKFNSIELNYMDKIKTLAFKVSFLQQKLQQSQQEKQDLMGSLQTYKSLYLRKQQEIDKEVEKKLQQIKSKLIDKFAQQCRYKYNDYITELKQLTTLLNQQKKKRKFYQDQNKVFKLEKENYQQMYKSLLKKQKQYLKIDIDKTRNQLYSQIELSTQNYLHQGMHININNNDPQQYSKIEVKNDPDSLIFQRQPLNRSNNFVNTNSNKQPLKTDKSKSKNKSMNKNKSFSDQRQSLSKNKHKISKQKEKLQQSQTKKTKKLSKSKSNHNEILIKEEMTKQQLIPFLAKGIQQLKQRLKMN